MNLRERLLVLILSIGGFAATVNAVVLVPTLQPIAEQFDSTEAVTGQIGTISAIVAGFTALIVAQWIDRFPRRQFLRIGTSIIVVGTLVTALAPAFLWLFLGRALTGLGGAMILPTCIAAAGDLFTDPDKRNRAVSTVWAATSLTLLVGLPLLTQINALTNWRWTVASVLVPFAILLAGTRWLPGKTASASTDGRTGGGLRAVAAHQSAVWLLMAIALFWVVFMGTYTYWGAFADTTFHATANQLSLLFIVTGAADLIGTYSATVALRWRSARQMVVISASVFGANLIAIGFIYTNLWSLYPYMVISGVSSGSLVVYASILLLDTLPSARGAVMSLSSAGTSLGGAAGTALAGVLLATQGYVAIYVGLGLVMPLMIACLAISFARSRSGSDRDVDLAEVTGADG